MSINPINHFTLTNWGSVHDEEALTALELQARSVAKINECVKTINEQITIINDAIGEIPGIANGIIMDSIHDGTIRNLINGELMSALGMQLITLSNRVDSIIAHNNDTDGNSELVDARTSAAGEEYSSLGAHVRGLGNGSAFSDAVRPGTVKAGRITAGMLGGELRDTYTHRETIPMAGHWNGEKGYFDNETLGFVGHTGYNVSDPIPCAYGDTFLLTSFLFGPLVYPAAFLNAAGEVVDVVGKPGASNWDPITDEIHISRGDVTHIRFVCGASQVANFRAVRVSIKEAPDAATLNGSGYLRMRAKVRTDTVTDRAQIKLWFRLPENHTAERVYQVPIQCAAFDNISGWTVRIFAATSDTTYDEQQSVSASGYTFPINYGLRPFFTLPTETVEGIPVTHAAIFVDFLPQDDTVHMDAQLMKPVMFSGAWSTEAIAPALHGAVPTDALNVVRPGAAGSHLYRKRILGMGDSLMAGNTLETEYSWFSIAAGGADMIQYNAAKNGSPVHGDADSMRARIDAALETMPEPDYFVLVGGANDKRLSVTIANFKAAISEIVGKVRAAAPRCKILLGTNWRRTADANSLGLYDTDYVTAMLETAEDLGVPCINNYAAGINLLDPAVAAWADEGIVSTGTANIHFSKEANVQIAEKYTREIELI